MAPLARDFMDRFGRRVLTDDGRPGRDGVDGVGSTTETAQGRIAAAICANAGMLDNAQLDELVGWITMFKSRRSTWLLYEHDDGRQAVCREGAATFSHGDPGWHRSGPVEVLGACDAPLPVGPDDDQVRSARAGAHAGSALSADAIEVFRARFNFTPSQADLSDVPGRTFVLDSVEHRWLGWCAGLADGRGATRADRGDA